jgi:hypothetical protein
MSSRVFPRWLGLLLIGTAALKLFGLSYGRAAQTGWLSSPQVQALAIQFEFVLGAWLAWGIYPTTARLIATVTFAGFAAVSLQAGWAGAASCSCFGPLEVSPWISFGIDMLALAGLAWPRPRQMFGAVLAGVGFVSLAVFPIFLMIQGGPSYPRALETDPASLDLGSVARGSRREFAIRLRNPRAQAVDIFQVKTSCCCLAARELPWHLGAGESAEARLNLDLRSQDTFTGTLLLTAEGKLGSGEMAFLLKVKVLVADR